MVDITDDGSAFIVSAIGDMLEFSQVGTVWVFERNDESETYTLLGEQIVSSDTDDGFGQSVGIKVTDNDDLMVVVGIPTIGRVTVFLYDNEKGWEESTVIDAGSEFNADSEFGYAISLSEYGRRIVVGARCYAQGSSDGCDGAVQVFDILGGGINAVSVGSILAGPSYSFFGEAVALSADGSTFVVGAPEDCLGSDCPGSVYLFEGEARGA